MTDYYKQCFQKGLEYQDHVTEILLNKLGICLSSYSSTKFQIKKGENIQGIEIKFDDRFKETGNIYIEVKEKANPNNLNYVDSGIFRKDNSWIYLIGDYCDIFIFSKKYLQLFYKAKKYREVTTSTSIGYLIPLIDAEKYCIHKIRTQ